MRRLLPVVLALAALAAPAASARVRVLRHPAPSCTFSLAPTWDPKGVPAGGLTRATVLIYGQSALCAQWNAYSAAGWAVVEAAPLAEQPAAYVTIAPNSTSQPRTTTLIIAGIRLDVTQAAAPRIANPNLVVNGTFDADIAGWTWYEGRFPNGRGAASWSSLDANGSPASGSILMRDSGTGLAFQRLQCIAVNRNTLYRFGAKVRTGGPSQHGDGAIAMFTYASTDCSGDFTNGETGYVSPAEPGVWQPYTFTMLTGSRTQSVVLVLASGAALPPFDTWFDDVFVLPAQ